MAHPPTPAALPRRTHRLAGLACAALLIAGGCRTTLGDGGERVGDFDESKLRDWLELVGDRNTTGQDVEEMVSDFTTYCTGSFSAQRSAVKDQYELSVDQQRPDAWWFTSEVLVHACPQRASQLLAGLPTA